jgi:hypothetical protein
MTHQEMLDPDQEVERQARERRIAAAVENLNWAAKAHARSETAASQLELLRAAATLWATGWRETEPAW